MKKLLSLLLVVVSLSPFAQPGQPNTFFGINGVVNLDTSDLHRIIMQPDGKLLVLGKTRNASSKTILYRFTSAGAPDSAFGHAGVVENIIGPDVALQADGRILTGGLRGEVMRLNPDGSLDSSFGDNGRAVPATHEFIEFQNSHPSAALAVQSDGKIVVLANPFNGSYYNYVLLRYTADGTPDSLFADNSVFIELDFEKLVHSLQLQTDKIVVVGYAEEQGVTSFVLRLTADGQVEYRKRDYNYDVWLRGIHITSDERYITWGWKDNFYNPYRDTSYHYDFFTVDSLTRNFDSGFSVTKILTQTDGSIVVAGKTGTMYSLRRFHPDTSVDTAFGSNGTMLLNYPIADMLLSGDTLYAAGGTYITSYLLNGPTVTTWYRDADGDGFGNGAQTRTALVQPRGYVANSLDCNDKDSRRGGPEVCDGRDNDCNGIIDDGFALKTFYSDFDGDSWGSLKRTLQACAAPPRYVSRTGDCDDVDNTVYPGAPELCDGRDNDCNGKRDDGLAARPFYWDGDGDGYGYLRPVYACAAPRGYIAVGGDCNDEDPSIHPGAVGRPGDGIDNNCNGLIDEPLFVTAQSKTGRNVEEEGTLGLQLSAAPNPATHYFSLRIQSRSNSAVQLRIIDNMGRVVEARGGVAANTTLSVGHRYKAGVYYAEAVQESKRTTVKLVKIAP